MTCTNSRWLRREALARRKPVGLTVLVLAMLLNEQRVPCVGMN